MSVEEEADTLAVGRIQDLDIQRLFSDSRAELSK